MRLINYQSGWAGFYQQNKPETFIIFIVLRRGSRKEIVLNVNFGMYSIVLMLTLEILL